MSDGSTTAAAEQQRLATDLEALTAEAGVIRGTHSLIWIRGDDAESFLDALISQSVGAAEAGSVRRSFLLTPQGKMRALLWVLKGASDEIGLVTQKSTAETVVADLTRFRFRVAATIEVESRPVVTLVGPAAESALLAADVPRPGAGWLPTAGGLVAAVPFTGDGPPRFVLVGDVAAAITSAAPAASPIAYEAVRTAAGEPLGNVDFDEKTISHELGPVDAAVDFAKGCYLGQELVARIDSRGRVNQTLRAVIVPDRVDLSGAVLTADEKEVGRVTSSAPHPSGDGTIALAIIRHEITNESPLKATLTNGTTTAVTVKPLPVTEKLERDHGST